MRFLLLSFLLLISSVSSLNIDQLSISDNFSPDPIQPIQIDDIDRTDYPFYDEKFDVYTNLYANFGNKILNGNLIVHGNLQNEAQFDIDNIDWDIEASSSPNTFSLYLHSLRPVYYLSIAYLVTNDDSYLLAADKIIKSWDDYDRLSSRKNRYAWYDHSVAERTENLIFFAMINNRLNGNREYLDKMIAQNAEWLNNDLNYTRNHNHGIFQDGALLKAGYFLGKEEYIETAINRLDGQLKFAFPNKHLHVENSIGYHVGIISYIQRITEFLHSRDNEYYQISEEYLNGALDYLIYAFKPDQSMPFIGDTIGSIENKVRIPDYGNDNLKYVLSSGKHGKKPEYLTRLYKDDGYIIFREHWNTDAYEDSSWLLFKSGYLSSTHKHADDLSLIFYSKGKDIFVDPGMYNYMVGEPIHDYMNSAHAHNTVIVDGKSYSIGMFNSRKVGIYGYSKLENYEVVTGYNNIYPDVNIDRSIYYLSGEHFFVVDDIIAKDTHDYTQIFHLSQDVSIQTATKNEVVLDIHGTNYVVLLQQLEEIDEVNVFSGDNGSKMSYISSGFNQALESTTIEFEKKRLSNTRFITSIRIIKSDELEFYRTHKPTINKSSINTGDITIPISSRDRLPDIEIKAEFEGNKILLTNIASSSEPLSYSFYLLDKESGRKYDSISYSNNNTGEFILDDEYALIAYMKNNSGETLKKLVGYIVKGDDGDYTFIELPLEKQEPRFLGHSMEKINGNTYAFRVDIENINKINARWYIYKNGASYDFVGNSELELEYEFKEPGNYTIIYRIGDNYFGEIEYNHFKSILIE